MKFLIIVTNFIFNIYHKFIYVGDMGKLHPKGYAKEHTIVIISFLLATNLSFIMRKGYFHISFAEENASIIFMAFAVSIYLFNRYFIFPKLNKNSFTFFESVTSIIYISVSLILIFL